MNSVEHLAVGLTEIIFRVKLTYLYKSLAALELFTCSVLKTLYTLLKVKHTRQ